MNTWIQTHLKKVLIKILPLGSFWAINVLKIPLRKKNVKYWQTEREKKAMNK